MDGGRAQVDREVDMSGASSIEGHGVLEVGGGDDAALGFSSTSELTPQGGNLRIDMTGGGTVAFGGAVIDVTADNSDLIVDGNQFGSIGDALRIGAGNRVDFEGPWEVSGALQFVGGGGELVGGSGDISGTTTVNNGMDGRIASNVDFTASAATTVNSLAELELAGQTSSAAGSETTLSYASTLRFNLPPSLAPSPPPIVNWNGELTAWSATIEANQPTLPSQLGFVQFNGDLTLTGSAFWGPSNLEGTAPIVLAGNTSVEGPGARINAVGVRFSATSTTTIESASYVQVNSTLLVNAGASITGAGGVTVNAGGLFYGQDAAEVGVDVVNHGVVRPGAGSDYSAHFELTEDYSQSETGVLEIDLAGSLSSQYDRLVVGEEAAIDGALAVTLRNGFEPALGDDFLVLSAGDGQTGAFSSTLLPALDEGLAWGVDYSPFSATLSVIEKLFTADANGNGVVEGGDFLVIQQDMGKKVPCAGDITGDYKVDALDVAKWKADYGQVIGSAVASAKAAIGAVPEPGAALLTGVAALALVAGRGRRSRP
jgi:hypothetical protein